MGKTLRLLLALGVLLIQRALLAADSSPDTIAKYLAGLAVPAMPAGYQATENPWAIHAAELDKAWQRTEQQQLPAIASWGPEFLGPAYRDNRTMFYMFSGPDFLYAHAFFPYARTYILCGIEPVGAIPDLSKIPPEFIPGSLANIRKSLESVFNWSFFITKEMKTDLTRTQLTGTLPLLYVFLARTGCTINSVTPVAVDRSGRVSEGDKGEASGVRIAFTSAFGLQQTLYYFCSDLSDDNVKSKPGFMHFCEQQGRGISLLKAASYLMHETGFSKVREFLLARSDAIVQDDSGIPLRFLERQNWDIRYCGQYSGPIEIFKKYWQPELAEEFSRNSILPLSFGFGYQWQADRSDLMIVAKPGLIAPATRFAPPAAVPARTVPAVADVPQNTPPAVAAARTITPSPPPPKRYITPVTR